MTVLFLELRDRGAVVVVGVEVLVEEEVVEVFVTAVVGGELVVTEAGFLATVFAGLAGT